MDDIETVGRRLLAEVAAAQDPDELERARVGALGKKGVLTARMKAIGAMDVAHRRDAGAALNRLKNDVARAIETRREQLRGAALDARLRSERLDLSLPTRPEPLGAVHPVSQVFEEIVAIFADMGFEVAEGPDIEDDFHNFTALNIPPEHPARQDHDTFYLCAPQGEARNLLRTHTSPVQIRTMRRQAPPVRIIVPGRTYRRDSDMTHTPMFHQVEGLVVDKTTHMGHLKGCLWDFVSAFFEVEAPVRFRPSYFPFTSPSAEMDIGCKRAGGTLTIGAGEDWLEILGCGMVHPNVLHHCGVDPGEFQGFAFGVGIDRVAMLKYGIPDLRSFFDADLRWLRHYGFAALDVPTLHAGLAR